MATWALVGIYLGAAALANVILATVGPWAMPWIALTLIGLDLTTRDHLHEVWTGRGLWPRLLGMIMAGSVLSWTLNPGSGRVALASAAAFAFSGVTDGAAYQTLPLSKFWKCVGSNTIGAAVDTLTFCWIAFGTVEWGPVAAAWGLKTSGSIMWAVLLRRSYGQPKRREWEEESMVNLGYLPVRASSRDGNGDLSNQAG